MLARRQVTRPLRKTASWKESVNIRLATYEELESTNIEVKRAIEAGEPEGFAVLARRQTGGYGRQGRSWASPEGGLYLSLLLRPNVPVAQLPTLSLIAGLAAVEAAAECAVVQMSQFIKLKWPNDVVLDRAAIREELDALRHESEYAGVLPAGDIPPDSASNFEFESSPLLKLAGISLELHRGAVCLGIGVNVARSSSSVEIVGKNQPVYLADLGCDSTVSQVATAFLRCFRPRYTLWRDKGFGPFVSEFEANSYLAGKAVSICGIAGNITTAGIVRGVDAAGCLLVDDGETIASISSGEAHLSV